MYSICTIGIFVFFCVLQDAASQSVPITINEAPIESPTDFHPIIDASPGSNSLKEHLASIVKLDAPIDTTAENLKPIPDLTDIPDISNVPDTVLSADPNENTDLKTDASGYYGGYGGYRQPYYQQYGQPYYQQYGNPYYSNYWSYQNRPYYQYYYPNNYYRRNDYYPGNFYYNPRRPLPSFW